ncbi:hypothetical protein BDK51DRAFT_47718 [Blyttiomyces helicus]|uniref:Uncharacterized protein n=1 Tax=Blyttiomyces helicus TaxID=388810 RepID=A0A4P9WJV0_9FUNG|nr:hypothetical protein BDK51DRAFT_47718 [Blyttiomyces helicus]|eukprot:RKO93054.1 hypothetical protein BDK51DRAFT_47718 [Blyttiomyces helicus]
MACVGNLHSFIIERQKLLLVDRPDLYHVADEFKRVMAEFETTHPRTDFTYPTTAQSYQQRFIEDSAGVCIGTGVSASTGPSNFAGRLKSWLALALSGLRCGSGGSVDECRACLSVHAAPQLLLPLIPRTRQHNTHSVSYSGELEMQGVARGRLEFTTNSDVSRQSFSFLREQSRESKKSRDKLLKNLGPFAMMVPVPGPAAKTPGLLAIVYHGPLVALRFDPEAQPKYLAIGPNGLLHASEHLSASCLFLLRLCRPPSLPSARENRNMQRMMQLDVAPRAEACA